jgi:hypothetical protein
MSTLTGFSSGYISLASSTTSSTPAFTYVREDGLSQVNPGFLAAVYPPSDRSIAPSSRGRRDHARFGTRRGI